MSDPKVGAIAKVRVELEIECRSSWGGNCAFDQIHKQAVDEVEGWFRNLTPLESHGLRFKFIGTPTVMAVVVKR